jgi:hypothetical protein
MDAEFKSTFIRKLTQARESYIELEVDWTEYCSLVGFKGKLNALIGINHARNEAFRQSRGLGQFSFILDGDCYFDETTWNVTRCAIEEDQQNHPERKYYAVPSTRVQKKHLAFVNVMELPAEEPMLVIRRDATELFDESLPFGSGDKVRLLRKLGVRFWNGRGYALNSEGPCTVVGRVLHLSIGTEELDSDNYQRGVKREESLQQLVKRADEIAAAAILKNQGSRPYLRFAIAAWGSRTVRRLQSTSRTVRIPKLVSRQIANLLAKNLKREGE